MERIGLFIDGANVYAAAKRLGWNFDHRKILEHFAGMGALYNAFYYTAVPAQIDDKQKRFVDALTYMGYTVRTRPLRENTDEHGDTSRRASLDIELVTDLLTTESRYDVAVLLSGDGDFERPVEVLRARGKRVIVASIPEMTSYELRNAADEYVDLASIREQVERPGYRLPSEGQRTEGQRSEGQRSEGRFQDRELRASFYGAGTGGVGDDR
ncbi:NYN domain-containing protein [Deinococcus wulumuqiensis]|uniref:NYN domain-containing protein n=1 Tax=Deinococcus wulumuqiensis TaxID=980427 RepID=A0A345IEC3_9DEIO|nr:NYN domain-containing protein [Deinococcus wulumuqiensis]AXG98045.1 NYN domain-containing protein [Deinococcus wulumuqiensis]